MQTANAQAAQPCIVLRLGSRAAYSGASIEEMGCPIRMM